MGRQSTIFVKRPVSCVFTRCHYFCFAEVGEVSEILNPDESSRYMNDLLHKKIRISGGGDCPEKSLTAVVKALEAVNDDSHVFLFTDASPKDSYTVEKVLAMVQRKRTRVITVDDI